MKALGFKSFNGAERLRKIISKYEEPTIETTQPIDHFKIEERWTVYLFSVPIKFSKKIAWGFESKEEAQRFITGHLKNKTLEIEDITYHIIYDVIFESREEIDVLYNDPVYTTVGNEKDVIMEKWVE